MCSADSVDGAWWPESPAQPRDGCRLGRVTRGTQARRRLHGACGPESLGMAAASGARECRTCQAPLQEALQGWA